MLGFLIGTACLFGLMKTLHHGCHGHRGGRYFRSSFFGHRCGSDSRCHGPADEPFDRDASGFGGRDVILRMLFRKLDTTHGQEKVIAEAADEIHAAARKLRGEFRSSREDVAKAVRTEHFDEVLFGEMFARHDAAAEGMRKTVFGALAKVHAVLDEKQRERLAELIERGPGFFQHGPFSDDARSRWDR